ncbi:MAG: VWA domain-containing protein [Actinomycetota bacterium]|nr:VWA domain-containing protein [Actinomycetota bacterium]MDA8281609.1 VWA domain-containing protein [Actinomycetota bacterium]
MLELLTGFVEELRAAGLPVSLTESIDAAAAMHHVPMEDRQALKYALAATLVKSADHWRAFDTAFEVFFSLRGERYGIDAGSGNSSAETAAAGSDGQEGAVGAAGAGGGSPVSAEDLAEQLYRALLFGDDGRLVALARMAVGRFAGMEPGRPVGGTYYLYRTLRQLDMDGLRGRLLDAARMQAPGGALSPLEERLMSDEMQQRLTRLRNAVEDEIRRRLVADRGAQALARSLRSPLPEEIDFMHATRDELLALQRAIRPLSRKLAVRLARKRRRGRTGPLDFRSTVRHSLSTGGVPVDLRFRPPHPAKPELVVIADISGSVASFARFTLHLVHALSDQFSKVRSFVFIDGIDEVTEIFDRSDDVAEAVHRVNTEADVVWVDGHSDYGHALGVFWERWGHGITSRTSVLVLGDARNNYHAPQAWVLQEVGLRARHLYWLNPEPRSYWGSGDSVVDVYGAHCDEVVEVRNLRQLEHFVSQLT